MSLDDIRTEHREWLAARNLLERPWFVLGSAPDPTIPEDMKHRAALIAINNVGITAQRLGLPPASLTFRNKNKEWKTLKGIEVPLVLWVCDRTPFQLKIKMMMIRAKLGEVRVMPRDHRKAVYSHMLGADHDNPDAIGKPSTGVFAVLYALFVGVPEIVLGGMSMNKQGYSYEYKKARMMHQDEDRFALETVARRFPQVSTSERVIHEAVGLPLYRPVDPASAGTEPLQKVHA